MDKNNDLRGLLKDAPEYEDYSANYLIDEKTKKCTGGDDNRNCGCACSKSSKSECNSKKSCCTKK